MKTVILSILLTAIIVIAAYLIIQNKEATMVERLVTKINDTRSEMEQTAKTTGLAQMDPVADSIVRDCTVRDRYENLLGRLDSLSTTELNEVQQLHAQCSHYYPTQKAFMANKLDTLVSDYASLISILENIATVKVDEYQVEAWQSLAAKELTRAALLRQQHEIQGRIITALVAENTTDLNNLLEEARKVADSLNVLSIQINQERQALVGV